MNQEPNTSYYLRVRDLESLIQAHKPKTIEFRDLEVLDYGCGSGRTIHHLRKQGMINLTGVDINDESLDIARQSDPGIEFIKIEKTGPLPFPSGRFDVIISGYVVCELESTAAILEMFKEISRLLKPGGMAIVSTFHIDFFSPDHTSNFTMTSYPENRNIKSGSRVKSSLKLKDVVFDKDYYWSNEDIVSQATDAKLQLDTIHCPLGKDDDGVAWICEKTTTICSMFVFTKPN